MQRLAATAIAVALVARWTAAVAQSPALPAAEVFVQQTGLKVTLQLPSPTVHVGGDPRFSLRFENQGQRPLHLIPHVVSNLFIETAGGRAVAPATSYISSRVFLSVRPAQLVRLDPGRSWDAPVIPEHHGEDVSGGSRYAAHGFEKDSGWSLLLPPGEYLARFTYINAPGYGAFYDPHEMPAGIWEGRIEAEPVRFTVVAATAEQLARDVKRISNQHGHMNDRLLPVLAQAPDALLEQFKTTPEVRAVVFRAARLLPDAFVRQIVSALGALPQPEREQIVYSAELSMLLRERADCATLKVLVGDLASSRGDVVSSLRLAFEHAAPECAEMRAELRRMLADAQLTPYARGNAAALLGTFRNPADVGLLIDGMEGRLPTAQPPPARNDPVAAGSLKGLALIGGDAAREAITRALADEQRSAAIGSEAVTRLTDFGKAEMVQPLIAALSSADGSIVAAAISGLHRLRAQAAVPRLTELMAHRNSSVRLAAAAAIQAIGPGGLRVPMRKALDDSNANVRLSALFYLAHHGDPADLELFLTRLDSRNQLIGEAARTGVTRLGTADTFPRVRAVLDVPHGGVQGNAHATLSALTFGDSVRQRRTPRQWDEWYTLHRQKTRRQWALESLQAFIAASPNQESAHYGLAAIAYLADHGGAEWRAQFERAAAARLPAVRIEAARAIARFDRARASALLIREFDSRFLGACQGANDALNTLTHRQRRVDCTDPSARQRAKAEWMR